MPGKQTWWQKQQHQKERTQEKGHHHPHPVATAEKFGAVPSWLSELIKILEAIWATIPASQSEPNHVVTQQLAAFKAKLPDENK
jgi:hypothetical protein